MSTNLISTVRFPFESDQTYSLGELRLFERQLLAARQSDSDLSKVWRVPNNPEMRRWVKLREETYPIKLLADHASYSDQSTFRLQPFGFPAVDAEIKTISENFDLQITIADPVWRSDGQSAQNGGYDHRLVMEALNEFGTVVGSANMRRENGKIISGLVVKDYEEEFEGCRDGLVVAFRRKLGRGLKGSRLLIHARGYDIHTMDFSLEDVAKSAINVVRNEIAASAFAKYYIVDEKDKYFF